MESREIQFCEDNHSSLENPTFETVASREEAELISSALDAELKRLSAVQRKIVRMRSYEGKSFTQIGHEIGMDHGNVGNLFYHAIEKIRTRQGGIRSMAMWRRGRGILGCLIGILLWPLRTKALASASIAVCVSAGVAGTAIFLHEQPEVGTVEKQGDAQVHTQEKLEDMVEGETRDYDPIRGVERVEVIREGRVFSIFHHLPNAPPTDGQLYCFHGECVQFRSDGSPRSIVDYSNGLRSGTMIHLTTDGRIEKAQIFRAGKYVRNATKEEANARRMRNNYSARGSGDG